MYAIVITTSGKENIRMAIDAVLETNLPIYVVTPDRNQVFKEKNVHVIYDKGLGKPAAINYALSCIKEDILILTDGDVYTDTKSIFKIQDKFDNKTGLVSGRVISLNDRTSMLGFWSHFLTYAADRMRIEKNKKKEYFEGSGYLMGIRKSLILHIPVNILSDDGYMSSIVFKSQYDIKYERNACVYVKYPNTLKDWIKQKKRSA
jgi:cellulose synthase/poly-beta-1,6-N-acetylglucosamine synthase-like glycosyltransferase